MILWVKRPALQQSFSNKKTNQLKKTKEKLTSILF
jgi:hypothetical protein